MPEYLAPGVFVEEIDSGSKPIEGVGTSTAAFIGYAKSGEFNTPTFVSSWGDFVRTFGENDEKVLKALADELRLTVFELATAKRQSKKSLLIFAEDIINRTAAARREAGEPAQGRAETFGQFMNKYGLSTVSTAYMEGSYLAYSVAGFFENGGTRAYIVRVPRADDLTFYRYRPEGLALGEAKNATATIGDIQVRSLKAGTAGNEQAIEVVHGEDDGTFKLKVHDGAKSEEHPKNGFYGPTNPVREGRIPGTQVEVVKVATATRPPMTKIALTEGVDAGQVLSKLPLESEIEEVEKNLKDFIGDSWERRGAKGLTVFEDVNFIAMPDVMAGVMKRQEVAGTLGPEEVQLGESNREWILGLQKQLIDYCELSNDRMAIIDCLPGLSPQQVKECLEKSNFTCRNGQAAFYYPWVRVPDQLKRKDNATILVPPSGHIAGVWARTAISRGVHKAPANESLMGAISLEREITKPEQEILNPKGINCIRTFAGEGIKVWGARTLATTSNPSWRYINVRALFNYLERSISNSLNWVVFEPNDHDLWGRVRRNISAFLFTEWKEGKLFGRVPEEAFYVKCNEETNPKEMIDLGRLYVEIGVNPVKPAEFVIIRIGQWSGGSEVQEN